MAMSGNRAGRTPEPDCCGAATHTSVEWQHYVAGLRKKLGQMALSAGLYPAVVIFTVAVAALYLSRSGRAGATPLLPLLLHDGLLAVSLVLLLFLLAVPKVSSLRQRYQCFSWVAAFLPLMARGRTLHQAVSAMSDPRSVRLAEALTRGDSPVRSLRTLSMPEEIVSACAGARGERDLGERLEEVLREYQEELNRYLHTLEQLLQPATVAMAGGTVLWLVIRLVIPGILAGFSGLTAL